MLKKLLVLSFIEGAVVMAAELCGARQLAPIFGGSLYVWASVMGITLAALAFGYFFGGWLSQKTKNVSYALFWVFNAAALFVVCMPVLAYYAVPRISYLPFLPGVVVSTIGLLFPPVFCLGATSPLFIALQANAGNSGKVSGMVYAISTLGGICATFLCGFYFIPEFGLTVCLVCFGGLLFVANLLVFKLFKPFQLLLLAGAVYLNLQFSVKKDQRLFVSDSLLGHLEVEEYVNEKKARIRILKVNNIIQTEMNVSTKHSVSEYIRLIDSLVPFASGSQPALVLGLGGGLAANVLATKHYHTDGVELDSRIIKAASDYFFMHKSVTAYCEDARYFMNHCTKKYQVVLIDVFKAEEQPSHVLTIQSLERLKQNLNDSALLLVNWHGYVSGPYGAGTAVLYNTLAAAGFYVKLCSTSNNEDHRNIIFVAGLKPLPLLPFQLNQLPERSTVINSDDFPRLEKYNALANKKWRSNYLRYYQGVNEYN